MTKSVIFTASLILAGLAGCATPMVPPSPEASCRTSLAQLDQALSDPNAYSSEERSKLYASCVAQRAADLEKRSAECKLEALETPMVMEAVPRLLPMIMAENRRTEIYNACMEARQ
jgi:hypothetical protein